MKFKFLLCLVFGLLSFGTTPAHAATVDLSNPSLQCQCSCQIQSLAVDTSPIETEIPIVSSDPGDLLISEFVSDPSGEPEWVELYNATDYDVSLVDWTLTEGSGRQTVLTGVIDAGGFVVFDKSSLNNSGDRIELRDPAGQLIDAVSYGAWDDGQISDNAPVAADPYSVIRLDVLSEYNIDFQDFSLTTTVTKGTENLFTPADEPDEESSSDSQPSEPEPEVVVDNLLDFSQDLRINEVFPNPEGSDSGEEWIELYNDGSESLNLTGWTLDDGEGGSTAYPFLDNATIESGSYLVISNEESRLILNNSVDSVRLFDPNQELISSIEYSEVSEGQALAIFQGDWQWTNQPTPGYENELSVEEIVVSESSLIKVASAASPDKTKIEKKDKAIPEVTLAEVRAQELGQVVKTKGVVSVVPNVFSNKVVYLQGSGLQVYSSKADFPSMKEGQSVTLVGKTSESYGERRLLLASKADMEVLDSPLVELKVLDVTSEDLGESVEGQLVSLRGDLVEKDGSRFVLADEFGEATVYIKQSTKISSSLFEEGDNLAVVGIVTQNKNEYRIQPRRVSDIVNHSLSGNGNVLGASISSGNGSSSTGGWSWVVLLVLSLAVLGFALWKYRELIITRIVGMLVRNKA